MSFFVSIKCRVISVYIWCLIILVIFGIFPEKSCSAPAESKKVVLGIISHHGYDESIRQWSATAEYLTDQIRDSHFTIFPFQNHDFNQVISQHEVDFVISCPSQYIQIEVEYGVTRIATMKTNYTTGTYDVFSGVLFWNPKNTQINNIEDLKGKKLIGPHGKNCTVWYAISHELMRYGFNTSEDLKETKFVATNEEIISAIRSGRAEIGVIRSDVFDKMALDRYISSEEFTLFHKEEQNHASIPFVHSTVAYPERVFSKLQHVPDDLAEAVTVSLISMSNENVAAKSAKCGGWTIPHNYQNLHECLKALKVSPYENYGRISLAGFFSQYKPWITTITLLIVLVLFAAGFIIMLNRKLSSARQIILEHQIMEMSDNAYRKFSQSLHDGLGQQLTGIKYMADTLEDKLISESSEHSSAANKISEYVHGTICQSRDLARGLDPVELSENGLVLAIEVLLRNIENTFNISCILECDDSVAFKEGSEAIHLYRIIQEAINNSIKHGEAKNIRVTIRDLGEEYVLTIEDDGLGFSNHELQNKGMGLHIMKYRANAIKSKLEINNRLGGGAMVRCTLPKKGPA